jgi:competence protein ComEA
MAEAVGPDEEANAAQRRRSAALVIAMTVAVVAGVVARAPARGEAPARCDAPVLVDGTLTCHRGGAPPGAKAWLAGARLDVNTATRAEIERIPDVGPALAAAIVDARDARGGFASMAELDDVPGVGPKVLARLERWLEVRRSSATPVR